MKRLREHKQQTQTLHIQKRNKIPIQKETTFKYTTLPRPHTQHEHMATDMVQHRTIYK
jgi:hypothetical protein